MLANDAVINVKVSTETKQILEAMADEQDITVSSIIRACIDRELGLQAVLTEQQLQYVRLLLSDILVHHRILDQYNFELHLGRNPKYEAKGTYITAKMAREEENRKSRFQQKVGIDGFYTESVPSHKITRQEQGDSSVVYVPVNPITQAKQDNIIQEAYPFIASHTPTYFPPKAPPKGEFDILPFAKEPVFDDDVTLEDILINDIARGEEYQC